MLELNIKLGGADISCLVQSGRQRQLLAIS